MGNAPSSGQQKVEGEEPVHHTASAQDSPVHSSGSNGLNSSRSLSNQWMTPGTKPFLPATPTSTARINGHSSTTVSRANQFNTSSDSILSSSFLSPSPLTKPRSSRTRHNSLHRINRSTLGVVPGIKYSSPGLPVNLPGRGSVRIPASDRITPRSNLKVLPSTRHQQVPSAGEVVDQLRSKIEKRKRDDCNKGEADNSNTQPVAVSPSSIDSKRRRHDYEGAALTNHEFVSPSTIPMENKADSKTTPAKPPGASTTAPIGVSPKRDGHLRTAIASSYSSSRRIMKRECPSGYEEPLYKRSINLNYFSSSRESSHRCSPVPIDRDSESETASRISVTPLPSVKNSPRSSPVSVSLRRSVSPVPQGLVNPKVEPKVTFPSTEEPLSGFVATFEDREHDDIVNRRRAKLLLGVQSDSPQVVMPIVKPKITMPVETKSAAASVTSVTSPAQSKDSVPAVSSESKADSGGTLQQMLSKTLDAMPDKASPVAVTEAQKASSLPVSSAEPTKATSDSVVKVGFSLPFPEGKPSSVTPSVQQLNFEPTPTSKPPVANAPPSTGFTLSAASFAASKTEASSSATSISSAPVFSFGGVKGFSAGPSGLISSTSDSKPFPSLASSNSTTSVASTAALTTTFAFGASSTRTSSSLSSVPPNPSQSATSTAGNTTGAIFAFNSQNDEASKSVLPVSSAAPTFKFGANNSTPATTSLTPLFGFGAPATANSTQPAATSTVASTAPFAFGVSQPSTALSSAAPVFSFGKPLASSATTSTATLFGASTSSAPTSSTSVGFAFGSGLSAAAPSTSTAAFSFGGQSATSTSSQPLAFGTTAVSSSSSTPMFGFGQPSTSASTSTPSFAFGQSSTKAPESIPFGQGSSSLFSVPTAKSDTVAAPVKPFAFGATTTSSSPFGSNTLFGSTTTATISPFGVTTTTTNSIFGASTTPSTFGVSSASSTSFSSTASAGIFTATSSTSKAFGAFGSNAATSKPAAVGFNFGASTTTSTASGVFGQTPTTSAAPTFTFGAASSSQNPFGAAATVATTTPFGAQAPAFGSSTSATSTPVFGAPSNPTPAFGSSQPTPNTNPFGQQAVTEQAKPSFNFGGSTTPAFGAGTSSGNPQFGTTVLPPASNETARFSLGTSKAPMRRRTRR